MAVPLAPFQRFAMWAFSPFLFSRLHKSRCCCFNTSSTARKKDEAETLMSAAAAAQAEAHAARRARSPPPSFDLGGAEAPEYGTD